MNEPTLWTSDSATYGLLTRATRAFYYEGGKKSVRKGETVSMAGASGDLALLQDGTLVPCAQEVEEAEARQREALKEQKEREARVYALACKNPLLYNRAQDERQERLRSRAHTPDSEALARKAAQDKKRDAELQAALKRDAERKAEVGEAVRDLYGL